MCDVSYVMFIGHSSCLLRIEVQHFSLGRIFVYYRKEQMHWPNRFLASISVNEPKK